MTRSFGDLIGASIGLTWEPEIHEFKLAKNCKFILIATGGVWKVLSNE